MLGIRLFHFRARPIFRSKLAVSFRECTCLFRKRTQNQQITSRHGMASPPRVTRQHNVSMCARVNQLLVLGMGNLQPLMTGIRISWVYSNPYGLGLMSLSPIIWKCHGSLTLAHVSIKVGPDPTSSGYPKRNPSCLDQGRT